MNESIPYNSMENILQSLNGRYVSLNQIETRRNSKILETLLESLVSRMRQVDKLFDRLYRNMFFGGSYYDGLKVGSPDEYDIDLLLRFPSSAECEVMISTKPGFVHVALNNKSGFEKLCAGFWRNYLDTQKVLSWMEAVIDRALKRPSFEIPWHKVGGTVNLEIKVKKGGPAFTIVLIGEFDSQPIFMSIDLVPCFLFDGTKWPANGFKQNPYGDLPEFFVVPKSPKSVPNYGTSYWRLSLQTQERRLIDSKEKLKPALRLLKKMRNTLGHDSISSYYLKTVVMWEANEKDLYFWYSHSLSYIFMHILKKYEEYLSTKKIPYFWYKRQDLLGDINPVTLSNIDNRLARIIKDIETNLPHNPTVIAKYLLTREEHKAFFQGEVAYEPPAAEGWCTIL